MSIFTPPTRSQPFGTHTFPSVEAALDALGQKVLGASIVITPQEDSAAAQYPPLDPGWLYYGKGPLPEMTHSYEDVARQLPTGGWDYSGWAGDSPIIYAIRAGSELARLNGLEPEQEVAPSSPSSKPVPLGLPPIPEGYVYIGEDNGGIVTGGLEPAAQRRELLWVNTRVNGDTWKQREGGDANGRYPGWHAAARVGSNLASLNAPEPTAELRKDLTAWREACHRKDEDIDKLLAGNTTLEAEAERLHALWHDAAVDATEQREEVKRLVDRLARIEKATMHLRGYREITSSDPARAIEGAAALIQRKDRELTRWEEGCRNRDGDIDKLHARIDAAEASAKAYKESWEAAASVINQLTAERNALHARVAELEKPIPYRPVKRGEIMTGDDEWMEAGTVEWVPIPASSVGKPYLNFLVDVRRPIKPD